MKNFILSTLLVTVALVTTAAAGQRLTLDTVVTDGDDPAKPNELAHYHGLARNGKPTVMWVGNYEYLVVPTIHAHGTVELSETVTRHADNGKDYKYGPYQRVVRQDDPDPTQLGIGSVIFATKTSSAK